MLPSPVGSLLRHVLWSGEPGADAATADTDMVGTSHASQLGEAQPVAITSAHLIFTCLIKHPLAGTLLTSLAEKAQTS